MRQARLIKILHYYDTSWGDSSPSTQLTWLKPSGRLGVKDMYGSGFWTDQQAQAWLEGKYSRRLTNLFGLLWYL